MDSTNMPNCLENPFVVHEHSTPEGVHWDLMLQLENVLRTWRLSVPPELIQKEPITAEQIADHPLRFLTYEGPVQNYTASVKIVDKGSFKITKQSDNEIDFETSGETLTGHFQLQLVQNDIWFLRRIG